MTPILETFGTIRPDGTLDLEQKLSPLPGRFKVHLEPAETESDDEFAKRFARLAAAWHEDTRYSSKPGRDADHPAYQEIIAMGERVVPLLLADFEKDSQDPNHWFIALHRITGANPVPVEEAGRTVKMAAAWIAWGRTKGYRWDRAA